MRAPRRLRPGPLASARLTFTLAPGTTVTQSWNATLSAASGRIEATLPAWATAPHEATGLCVSGTGEPGPVDLG